MKNSKSPVPSSREAPEFKLQTITASMLKIGSWNFLGAWSLDFGAFLACATCHGRSDSPMAHGMNAGIFTLMGVIATVLACIALFFVHVARGEKGQNELNDNNPAPKNPSDV